MEHVLHIFLFFENFEELCSPYGAKNFYDRMGDSGSSQNPRAKSRGFFLGARKRRGCFYVVAFITAMGAGPVVRPTRSRLYKRDHSPLRPNFDPPYRREFWKRHRREEHKRRSPEDRGFRANPGRLDISSRLSCWFRADVKEPYPRYVRLFSGTRNFLIFTMCRSEIYVCVRCSFSSNLYSITHGILKITNECIYPELRNKISFYPRNVN